MLEVTLCAQCGTMLGAPHVRLTTDCVLDHPDHAERKHGLLCGRHWHHLADTLTQIEQLAALLPQVLIPGPAGDGRSATRTGSPAPGSVDVMALTDPHAGLFWRDDDDAIPNVPGALHSWCRLIGEELPPDEHRARPDGTLPGSLRFLRTWRHWIVQQPWIDDYAADLGLLHRALAVGVGEFMWPRPLGRCPNCQAKIYPDPSGADVVTCGRCRSSWSGVHWLRLRLMLEKETG